MYHWEADDIAGEQLASLPHQARLELARFMDAVVIVDPIDYQRSPQNLTNHCGPCTSDHTTKA